MKYESTPVVAESVDFLRHIGLQIESRALPGETFLPGITVDQGTLQFDPEKLKYPGDLLHEAGHLAVLPPAQRRRAGDDFAGNGGGEMAAIAWSYAACLQIDLPLEMLFHDQGYKGDARWLRQTFADGKYIGLPILIWRGMTSDEGDEAFPRMTHWLCP